MQQPGPNTTNSAPAPCVARVVLTKGETTRSELEIELLATALLEHEGPSTTTTTKGVALERVTALLSLLRVGVVASIEARPQFGVAQHLVGLVDARHLLLRLLLADARLHRLVGVVHLGHLAVRRLDLSLVGVVGDPEHLVVILCLATLQCNLGFLQQRVDNVFLLGPRFGRLGQRVDAGLELLGLELCLGFVEKTVEGVRIPLQGLLAVDAGLLAVHLRYLLASASDGGN